jgi:aminopeptidase N
VIARAFQRAILRIAACLVALIVAAPCRAQAILTGETSAIDVIHYDATIQPDIAENVFSGRVTIAFAISGGRTSDVEFDAGNLIVDAVTERSRPLRFERQARHLRVRLVDGVETGRRHEIAVAYHGQPRGGLTFIADPPQALTAFSTSDWMVCIDAPGDRATFRLHLVVPQDFLVVANGAFVRRHVEANGLVTHEWNETVPMPSYVFGFAAGRFREASADVGGVTFRHIGAGLSAPELQQIFSETPDILAYFEARAGVRYGSRTYTEVLAGNGGGQEMSGYTLLPDSYGRNVLADGRAGTLAAHELAHQWWGNLVTCQDWREFWLNEGFATFMAAAYIERRDGRDAYDRVIAASRDRYLVVKNTGHDRPLVFPDWNHPTMDDRTIVYQKGAYVLSLLRERLGETAFWNGVKQYTRQHAGRSVTSADLQRAMERASRQDLSSFFAEWVYPSEAPRR